MSGRRVMSFLLLGYVISIFHSPIAPQSTVLIINDIHKNNHTDVNVIHTNLCHMDKPFTGAMDDKTRGNSASQISLLHKDTK